MRDSSYVIYLLTFISPICTLLPLCVPPRVARSSEMTSQISNYDIFLEPSVYEFDYNF